MYLKFINENAQVIRYNEVKKRIIIGMVRDFKDFGKNNFKITVNKVTINITKDIELLHNILKFDFKNDYYKFQSVFNNANFYVAIPQQEIKNILVLFGDLYLDLQTRQFYSVPIINGNVLLQNIIPAKAPYYYET